MFQMLDESLLFRIVLTLGTTWLCLHVLGRFLWRGETEPPDRSHEQA